MPDRDVETIQDLIFYQYAKIIARRAFSVPDGKEAKQQHYGFVKDTFRDLKSGVKSWSEISEFGSPVACPGISFSGMTGEEVARVELYSRARSFDSASLRSG